VLRALHRLLRPEGRLAFTTIYVASGLTAAARQRARRSGPRAVASRREHCDLLASAGFIDIDEIDLTAEFAVTARAWLTECEANAEQLSRLESARVCEQRQRERRAHLRAIEDGLIRRSMFSAARRPIRH
jgi:hypothetical protein